MLYMTTYNIDSMFENDVLLVSRYFESIRKKTLDPEKKLMLALLENGIEYFQKYIDGNRPREKRRFREAEEWIMDKSATGWCFSFENACEMLRLDPEYVRKGVRQWQVAHYGSRLKARVSKRLSVPSRRQVYVGTRMVGT
jgi:hypothetical protein